MKKNTYITIVLGVLVVVFLSLWLVSSLNKRKVLEEKKEIEADLNELKATSHMWEVLLNADDQFCSGNFEEAIALYTEFDELSGKQLATKRRKWLEDSDSSSQFLLLINTGLKGELKKMNQLLSETKNTLNVSNNENSKLTDELRRLNLVSQNKLDSLKQAYQKEKNVLIAGSKYDTVSFSSSKNYKIRYFGQVSAGKANGIGSGNWSTGGYYHGEWKNNQRHGKGLYYWIDGERYTGEYVNDIRQGIGTYYWKNGEKYEGGWKNNQRNGFGTLYDASGKVKFKGEWINDQPKE